jgi:hypothetical protein
MRRLLDRLHRSFPDGELLLGRDAAVGQAFSQAMPSWSQSPPVLAE